MIKSCGRDSKKMSGTEWLDLVGTTSVLQAVMEKVRKNDMISDGEFCVKSHMCSSVAYVDLKEPDHLSSAIFSLFL